MMNQLARMGAKAPSAAPVARRAAPVQRSHVCRSSKEVPSDAVDFEELADIVKLVNATDIVEMEWKGKRFNISLKKAEALKAAEPVYQMMAAAPAAMAPAPAAPASAPPAPAAPAAPAAPRPAAAAAPPPPAATGGIEIRSPMSGTFYSCAAPGDPPFCKVGDKVKKGQTVGIIEAMKLMNEIEAEASGEVVKIMAQNGTPITAGQPLLLLK
ncbi:hypothetical protein FOA52_004587 [Chlamydomonas sp. UWO 241]|nr:hypothetical protein FOA52_004587 [Chlamydomonas sp. UWO 241]